MLQEQRAICLCANISAVVLKSFQSSFDYLILLDLIIPTVVQFSSRRVCFTATEWLCSYMHYRDSG